MMDMGGFGSWGMGFGAIFMILFWGLVIVGIVALLRGAFGHPASTPRAQTPLEIIETRYARGEIKQQEFEEKKRALTQG